MSVSPRLSIDALACIRGGRFRPDVDAETHVRVALAAPPSMVQLGLTVSTHTLDLVVHAHTANGRGSAAVTARLTTSWPKAGAASSRTHFVASVRS